MQGNRPAEYLVVETMPIADFSRWLSLFLMRLTADHKRSEKSLGGKEASALEATMLTSNRRTGFAIRLSWLTISSHL